MSVLLLGCGFTGKAAGCESQCTLFTTVVYAHSKVVIECFVSTTDAQILQSILDLVHAAGKTERSELSVLYGNISPMHKQCIPGPLPSFGRGLSTRLLEGILND